MPADRIQILNLVLPYLIPTAPSPLSRPSQRYSILLKLSILSRSIHDRIQALLHAEVYIAAGNSQLVPLLASLERTPTLAKLIKKLSFVSRHKEAGRWNLDIVETLIDLCTEVRELVVAIPTVFGLNENFLRSKALTNLKSLTLATPIRRSISSQSTTPPFDLTSISILPPFSSSAPLSFAATFEILLSPRSETYDSTSLWKLVNLSISDSHHHPFTFPPRLARAISGTLESIALPRYTHLHSYAGGGGDSRYSCDPPENVHPSRIFLDHFTSRSSEPPSTLSPSAVAFTTSSGPSRLKYVYLPNLGHLGTIHHLPKSVEFLVIGPSRFKDETEEMEELKTCLINTKAVLKKVELMLLKKKRKDEESLADHLKGMERMIDEVEQRKVGCKIEVRWI